MADCLFCKIISHQVPGDFIYEDDEMVAFKDIQPKAPTHVLVAPKKHIASLSEAGDEDAPLLGRLQRVAAKIAAEKKITGGFRLVANNGRGAGQSVDHLHYHLLGGRAMNWPPG
jgi:histidine triad (HIT) family protein